MNLTNPIWDPKINGFLPIKDPLVTYGESSPYYKLEKLLIDLPFYKDFEGREQGLLSWQGLKFNLKNFPDLSSQI